tara:strand:- start:3587 stop:4219 length:633 start_codon:yes stop_codon:yes gene_type:complete
MNYIIEDGIDFFAELAKEDVEEHADVCLLSGAPIGRNNITLKCNHQFNYGPLYHEAVRQKTVYNPNDNVRLMLNEIKCPYCRQISPELLPFIPAEQGVLKIKGVNYPKFLCMEHKQCGWRYKSGKKQGQLCGDTGFDTDHGTYCTKHWGKVLLSASKHGENGGEPSEWTTEMEGVFRSNTVVSLKEKLREKNLKLSGAKKDLVMRLVLHK